MPIGTNSAAFRDSMQMRNLYTPNSIYDLNQDLLTQTLNLFQAAGFDLRTSLLINAAERIVDNTPLVQIGTKRLAMEMGRKLAVNLINEKVGRFDPDALLSKDPKRKLFTKSVDARITPVDKTSTNIGDMIARGLTGGTNTKIDVVGSMKYTQLGGLQLYDQLGEAQKAYLHRQLSNNYYNRFPNGNNVNKTGEFNLTSDFYNQVWVNANRADSVYSSYIMDRNGNKSLDTHDSSIDGLVDMLHLHNKRRLMPEAEGFGATTLPKEGENDVDVERFLHYSALPPESGVVTDLRSKSKFNIQRGLLYYTQQMASTKSVVGHNIRTEATEFQQNDGTVTWKGSTECRSWTMQRQYDRPSRLMRWKGNGNSNSVLEKSVIPRMYPVKPEDNRKVMLSLENLAWGAEDMAKLPLNERGPNKGRIMWFPPYGLTLSESAKAKYDTTEFLGRIEPVYSYSGAERTASLTFELLIDTPPDVSDYSHDSLGAFFAHCATKEAQARATATNGNPTARPVAPVVKSEPFGGNKPTLYFENNSDNYSSTYELVGEEKNDIPIIDPRNAYSLNAGFTAELDKLAEWVRDKYRDENDNNTIRITIEGTSSALAKNDYNAQLSFRRAHELMLHFITIFQDIDSEGLTLKTPLKYGKGDYADDITKADAGKLIIEFPTTDGRVTFVIKGKGEEFDKTPQISDEGSEIHHRGAKIIRKATITDVVAKPGDPQDKNKANVPTLTQKNEAAQQQQVVSNSQPLAMGGMAQPAPKQVPVTAPFATGWNKIDYYKSVFHSQTPYDFYKRYTFLHQITRPGDTQAKANNIGSNSLFGKMPVCVLRIGDFFHTKVIITSVQFDMSETTWDQNPEGMGMQPMHCKVRLDMNVIGGMSLEGPVDRLLTAVDTGFTANSSFSGKHYSKDPYNKDGRSK